MDSWQANAGNWIATIDNNEIGSRVLVTNQAIVETVLLYQPAAILDIGCGEGWLTRALRQRGIDAFGVDAIGALVKNAIEKDGEHYAVASFEELADGAWTPNGKMDAAVINFALLDESGAEALIKNIHRLVKQGGHLFIQTLHPFAMAASSEPYESGWKAGSWAGMKRDFVLPYQWYFRTMEDWLKLFIAADLHLTAIREPLHPETRQPASVIFVLTV